MKRHAALVPLSHDHHQGLVQARRLRRAAESGDKRLCAEQARAFLELYDHETLSHFREEEELLFPLALSERQEPPALLVRALVDHIRIHSLVAKLRTAVRVGEVSPELAALVGRTLEAHIRLEERELFPLIEQIASDGELESLALSPRDESE